MNDIIVNPDKFQAMITSCDKKKKTNMIYKLNFEKYVSTIISFYVFLSRQYSLLYIYLYIINVSEYLFLLSKNKESYLYYYYYIKVVRFSLDPLPRLPLRCCKIILQIIV